MYRPTHDLSPKEFGYAIVQYTNSKAPLGSNKHEEQIPQDWTYIVEGTFPSSMCLVNHGLIDYGLDRGPIWPAIWHKFERSYRSPQAEIVERIYEDCQGKGIMGLEAINLSNSNSRNPYFTTRDFWSETTQNESLQEIFRNFAKRNWLTSATRKYKDEADVTGLAIPGIQIFDVPTNYRGLERTATNMIAPNVWGVATGEYPKVEKFGERIPVCHMVARTIEDEGDMRDGEAKPFEKLIKLVQENTTPTPILQKILYVLGDVNRNDKKGNVTPRHVGMMTALMLEFAYGTPVGVRFFDRTYMVGQRDMNPEEVRQLENSMDNYEHHREQLIKHHIDVFYS